MLHYFRQLRILFKRLLLLVILFQLSRLAFYLANLTYFKSAAITELLQAFLVGFRFDLTAIIAINFIFILLHLIPGKWFYSRFNFHLTRILFFLVKSSITKPIRILEQAATKLTQNYNSEFLEIKGEDELANLYKSFRTMQIAIVDRIKEVERYSNNLEKLVEERTEEIQKQREQLIKASKMSDMWQMSAGIAHEINNPLQGVLGHLELVGHRARDVLPAQHQRGPRRGLRRVGGGDEQAQQPGALAGPGRGQRHRRVQRQPDEPSQQPGVRRFRHGWRHGGAGPHASSA